MNTRDCECQTHDGPHWLHNDILSMRLNLEMLEQATTYWGVLAFGDHEQMRLQELAWAMQQAGMAQDETIWAWMERVGWEPAVIMECKERREAAQNAIRAALARLAGEQKEQVA